MTPLHHAGGYTGLGDVQAKTGGAQIDAMESFFLSETLKYLFLLFSPRELVQLESNLFNTEAHPFSVFNKDDLEKAHTLQKPTSLVGSGEKAV